MFVAAYQQLIGDRPVEIGDPPGITAWTETFSVQDIYLIPFAIKDCFLLLSVKGLGKPPGEKVFAPDAQVLINEHEVGTIPHGHPEYWSTQIIAFGNYVFTEHSESGTKNEITILAAPHSAPVPHLTDRYQNFFVKNLVIFYQKRAEAQQP